MKFLLLVLFSFVTISVFSQSPWVPGVNNGFIQVGYSGLYYDQVRYDGQLKDSNKRITDQTYQVYLDFGLWPKVGLTASLPWKIYNVIDDNGSESSFDGLSNINLGLKYLILDKDAKVSMGLNYTAPSVIIDDELGLKTGYDATTLRPYITIGSSTKKTYFYANAAYGIRMNGYSDFANISGEIGYQFVANSYLVGFIDITQPLNNNSEYFKNEPVQFQSTASFLDRQLFNGVGVKLIYQPKPKSIGVIISTIGALGSTNTPFSRSYNFSVFKKF